MITLHSLRGGEKTSIFCSDYKSLYENIYRLLLPFVIPDSLVDSSLFEENGQLFHQELLFLLLEKYTGFLLEYERSIPNTDSWFFIRFFRPTIKEKIQIYWNKGRRDQPHNIDSKYESKCFLNNLGLLCEKTRVSLNIKEEDRLTEGLKFFISQKSLDMLIGRYDNSRFDNLVQKAFPNINVNELRGTATQLAQELLNSY